MSYNFFFSHARRDMDKYLSRFHHDLETEVAQRTNQWVDTGFRDAREIERGEWWETKLGTALSGSQVFLFISSPTSVASQWCGKEWAGFSRRCVDYQTVLGLATPPKLMIPIIWRPTEPLPPVVSALQADHEAYGLGDVSDYYKKNGLLQLMKLKPRWYAKFLDQVAGEVVNAAKMQPLTDHPFPTDFSTLASAFPLPRPDRFRARFVYVVAGSTEVGVCRTKLDAYDQDKKKWKPFYPPSQSDVATIAYQAVLQADFDYEDVPLGYHLTDEIEGSAKNYRVLVFMVDAWALQIPKYRDLLQPFESGRRKNCVVVVPWNLNDAETSSNSDCLWTTLLATLRSATTPDDRAADGDELRIKVIRGLIRGRKSLLEEGPDAPGDLPPGNIPLARISAVKEP
jgi:FxsC-like protein